MSDVKDMSRILFASISDDLTDKASRRIDRLLKDPQGVPNGKNKRMKLTPDQRKLLKSELIHAVGHASVYAADWTIAEPGLGTWSPARQCRVHIH